MSIHPEGQACMRVGIIAHLKYPISEPFAGGLEMHTHMLARLLRQAGHDVRLYAAEGSDPALSPETMGPPTGEPQTQLALEHIALAEHRAYKRILQKLRIDPPDVIHNNSLHYLPVDVAHLLPAPMLTVLHTPPFPELRNAVAEQLPEALPLLAVSASVAQEWRPWRKDVEIVPNGVELDRFRAMNHSVPRNHALWYGRMVPEKGPHLAIDAARMAGMPLRMAGAICDTDYWHGEVAPRLGGAISYIGHLDHASLAEELAAAAVAVCTPRWEEPFGLVVAEALASGTPVAGFARGALPQILDAECGVLAPADDVPALARSIRAAAGLSRAACRRRAESICDAGTMIAAYEAAYLALLQRRPLPGGRVASQSL
ncbi:glycosyltransferase [Pseudoroseomonas globiformis]|uniref:Glycosyltransferase n=1 Tax=Teichococcus globiformis TaxID=2307229 RepID=A0ABV7FWJ6_9PROT